MGEFTGVVFGFPTVLFTGGLVAVVAFWTIVLVGAADAHGSGHDAGGGHLTDAGHAAGAGHLTDAGHAAHAGHAAADGGHGGHGGHGGAGGSHGGHGGRHDDGGSGGRAGALASAGLGGVPVTVVLSLLIAFGWFLSLAASAALRGVGTGIPAALRFLLHLAVLAVASAGSWFLTWLLVHPLRRLFPNERPPSREDFVGRLCVIRTGSVTERFGQAEVAAPDGSTAVVQVRRSGPDTFTAGSSALLYAYDEDGEFFWVAPFGPFDPQDPLGPPGPADPPGPAGPPGPADPPGPAGPPDTPDPLGPFHPVVT